MFVENSFPDDIRVKNEADALTGAGYSVTVVALRKKGQRVTALVDGIRVYRIPRLELFQKTPCENPTFLQKSWLRAKALLGYMTEYFYFTTACFVMSIYVATRHGFDVIHAHNPPDSVFLVALPYKLLGKKYVFDHHDLCPELYRSRYGASKDFIARMLQFLEWCSLKMANVTIATNESYKAIQIQRGGRNPESVFVVRNGPNTNRMQIVAPCERLRASGKKILCYIGSLNPQDGVDYLLRSLHQLRYVITRDDFHCVIMGTGDSLEDLRALAHKLRLDGHVDLTGYVSEEDLRANLAAADICLDPDPSSPLNDVSTWIKIMEYMAYAKPIVTFDLKETRFSAQDAAVYVQPNREDQFARAIAKLMDNPGLRKTMGQAGRQRVEQDLQWSVVGQNLLSAYQSLFNPRWKQQTQPVETSIP